MADHPEAPGNLTTPPEPPVKIDFAIVGAMKSASSSLHHYLRQHDAIYLTAKKEFDYFLTDAPPDRNRRFEERYAGVKPGQLVGLTHVDMLFDPDAAGRLHRHNRAAKIVAILRNPIERAYSGYWLLRANGRYSDSFEEAIHRETTEGFAGFRDKMNYAHLERGHYAEQLIRYFTLFGERQVRVLLTEDLAARTRATIADLLAWLGVSGDVADSSLEKRYNVSNRPRLPGLPEWSAAFSHRADAVLKRLLPSRGRAWLYSVLEPVDQRLRALNRAPFQPPEMRPETRLWLRDYYRPHNQALGKLLNRDLSHWT